MRQLYKLWWSFTAIPKKSNNRRRYLLCWAGIALILGITSWRLGYSLWVDLAVVVAGIPLGRAILWAAERTPVAKAELLE